MDCPFFGRGNFGGFFATRIERKLGFCHGLGCQFGALLSVPHQHIGSFHLSEHLLKVILPPAVHHSFYLCHFLTPQTNFARSPNTVLQKSFVTYSTETNAIRLHTIIADLAPQSIHLSRVRNFALFQLQFLFSFLFSVFCSCSCFLGFFVFLIGQFV